MQSATADGSHVGGKHEMAVAHNNAEAHIVGAVVRHLEGRDFKIQHLERNLLIDWRVVIAHTLRDVMALHETVHDPVGAEQRQMLVGAKKSVDILYMVAVVVGKENAFYLVHGNAGAAQLTLNIFRLHPGVDEYSAALAA